MFTVHRLALLLALGLLAGALFAPGAGAQPAAGTGGSDRVLFPANCRTPVYKPARIVVTCADANFILQRIRWSSWTATRAVGTGTARVNSCNPDCAAGKFASYPARVTLTLPRQCRAGRPLQFVRIAVTFTGERPAGFPRTDRFHYGCGFS